LKSPEAVVAKIVRMGMNPRAIRTKSAHAD
jgi:hypothetical protein